MEFPKCKEGRKSSECLGSQEYTAIHPLEIIIYNKCHSNMAGSGQALLPGSHGLMGEMSYFDTKFYTPQTFTFCRNLQRRGNSFFWSSCSTMCVRLRNESLSLQLHTAELWTWEPCARDVRKVQSSLLITLMMKLEETRESVLMLPFAACRSWSRS